MKDTSRRCSDAKCGARLKDTVLDWEVTHRCLNCLANFHHISTLFHWRNAYIKSIYITGMFLIIRLDNLPVLMWSGISIFCYKT